MDSLVQTIHFWHVMVELKINLFFITFMKDPSFPYLAVVTLVYLAAVKSESNNYRKCIALVL